MPKTLILYDSSGGNTKKMAEIVAKEFKAKGADYDLVHADNFSLPEIMNYDGYFVGTPNYFGGMSNKLKKIFDESVQFYKKLDGRLGAAFCSTGVIGGGAETAVMDILKAMLIHGMVIQGNPHTGHYGVASIGAPDSRVESELKGCVERFVKLMNKLGG